MEEGLVLSPIEQILEDLIWHADQQDDYPTATRYAEILFASLSDTTPTTTRSYPSWAQREHGYYRLTQCLFRESKFQEVRKLLTSNDEDQESLRSSIRCRFKLALACHNLMYFVEANSVVEGLLKLLPVDQAPPLNIRDRNVVYEKEGTPHVSRVLALQGSITRAQGRSKEAPDFLTTSLEHNPFNLSAIKDIAELGKLDIESLYEQMLTNTNALTATTRKRQREDSASGVMEHIKEEESEDAANTVIQREPTSKYLPSNDPFQRHSLSSKSGRSLFDSGGLPRVPTPPLPLQTMPRKPSPIVPPSTSSTSSSSSAASSVGTTGKTILRRGNTANARKTLERAQSASSLSGLTGKLGKQPNKLERSSTTLNFSKRLALTNPGAESRHPTPIIVESRQENEQPMPTSTVTALVQSPASASSPLTYEVMVQEREAIRELAELLKNMSGGYALLCNSLYSESEDLFNKLPLAHRNSPWVLRQMAKCHFGMSSHKQAVQYFEKAFRQGWSVEDASIYSTCLWQLRLPYELGKLSMDTEDLQFRSPETCCVIGNKFSLAKEHLLAVKYFKRAIFVDRRFTYAYTLVGHEFLELGQVEEAGLYFQRAIGNDPRYHLAWYGMGLVQERLQKWDYALVQYRTAYRLNPKSSVLATTMGKTLERLELYGDAKKAYEEALRLDANNTHAGFSHARMLRELEDYENADKQLVMVERLAPDLKTLLLRASVKTSLGQKQEALRYLDRIRSQDPNWQVKSVQKHIDRAMAL